MDIKCFDDFSKICERICLKIDAKLILRKFKVCFIHLEKNNIIIN